MSDFSSLCPLFNTGVYSEITFPWIVAGSVSTTTSLGPGIPFGRSVIVNAAYARLRTDISTTVTFTTKLAKAASWAATRTVFASCRLSGSNTAYTNKRYKAFTVTAKTFTATDVLHIVGSKNTAMKTIDVIVRYKER